MRFASRDANQAKTNKPRPTITGAGMTKSITLAAVLLAAGGSPEDMRKLVKEETSRWTEMIRKAGIQPE